MFTATLALALTLAPAQSGPVTLKWSLKEGDTFYAKSVVTQNQAIGLMGQNIEFTVEITMVTRYRVKSVGSAATVIELTYTDAKMDAKGLPIPGLGDFGTKLKGSTVTATLSDKGEVTKVEGYEKMLDKIAGGDDATRKILGTVVSEASVKEMIGQALPPVPNKPVKVGDTWTESTKVPLSGLGTVNSKQTFKLESATDSTAKVGMTGELTFKAGGEGDAGLPFKITKANLKTDKFTGTQTIDLKAGRLKDGKAEMAMSGTMTISAGGQEIEATIKQKTTTTTTVTDKNPVTD